MLSYGGLSTFYSGLEGRIGSPSPSLHVSMEREHCREADSRDTFTASNYGVTTTAETEWWYVVDPDSKRLESLKLSRWPEETHGIETNCRRSTEGQVPTLFARRLQEINAELSHLKEPQLVFEELLGGRLYTGPVRRCHHCLISATAATWQPTTTRQHYTCADVP